MKYVSSIALAAILLVSCQQEKTEEEPSKIAFTGITESIKPGDNFFDHVNKSWYDTVQIADDQVGVGSYSFLNIPQRQLLQDILEEVSSAEHEKGTVEQKVGDFFASGMDTATINQRGYAPVKPLLEEIEAISNTDEVMDFVTAQISKGNNSIMGLRVAPDNKNSQINILHAGQSGLGLPDRDYYFKTDASTTGIQDAYKTYVSTLFDLSDIADGAAKAETVYNIEKQLAEAHKTRIERRDIQANYNKLAVSDITASNPNIDWATLLDALGLEVDSINVRQPDYYNTLDVLLGTVPVDDWKTYLKAHTLEHYARFLSVAFEDALFEYNKVLLGQSKQQPRPQIMAQQVDRNLGFALGQLYVKRYFDEAAKQRVLDLVNNLQKAFENRMSQLDWMSDSTKAKAKEKLYAITKKIGYPDVWREYDVDIERDQYFENVVTLQANNYTYNVQYLNKPPNKDAWGTTPSTVTAYYNPSLNEIVFPAGILQFPYFDMAADDAVNYGGIGMVIGHELTHAFDDNGSQYDGEGNLKNWWTASDLEKFKGKTQQLIDRYSSFTVLDTVHLKGAMTIGENTADNGGIAIAYDAFKMTEQGQDTVKIGGYTPDQRFFLSIARIWRVKVRDEFMRNYVNTNSHSPAIWRVNGPLMNLTPFYEAFDVQPGGENYKPEEERIKIW
ncbi:M13 family metallopeptidase [Muricauda sp. 334s03]|uniref:M13 family metallopeptidase n=1 Tax=Flagellimonas yonaguniensis TaxID=3031325 RepID=A0ABT5Y4G8_9FLAO|nr:M13 family metallopeptidase [[Muricauda] yonaguniensis]MDF0718243.1 M13 family metallopeptidase [[Muricauda] yonaguniensis]